jgi:dUTP pyrophosphatase
MKIYVKNTEGVVLPKRGTELSAGYDIVATSDPKIVGERNPNRLAWYSIDYIEYETNLFIAPAAASFHTLIHPRSSISKYNLVLANSIGLIDNDYRGMVICRFKYIWQPRDMGTEGERTDRFVGNPDLEKVYKKGDKIAQLVFGPTVSAEFELVDELSQTQRGAGGFGSTTTPPQAPQVTITTSNNPTPKSVLMEKYSASEHNLPLPDKNAYLNALREREKQIGQ